MEGQVAVKRIAVLHTGTSLQDGNSAGRIRVAGARLGIEVGLFTRSEDIVPFAPDFVLALSGQDPKLTGFPTYGVIGAPDGFYQQTPRLMRNVASYDAYLTGSKRLRRWLKDLCFGARKRSAPVGLFFPSVPATPFATTIGPDSRIAVVGEPPRIAGHGDLLGALSHARLAVIHGGRALPEEGADGDDDAIARYRDAGIGLCLIPEEEAACDLPPVGLLEIVAAGAVAICTRTPFVEEAFGDSVLYIGDGMSPGGLMAQVTERVSWVRRHPEEARAKAAAAHAVLQRRFTLERLLPEVIAMHGSVLVEKGYVPAPGAAPESLPSVSFIMRTGGRPLPLIRRALDSLVAQNHPRITVILVLRAPFPALLELPKQYPQLAFTVVEAFGAMRSTALVEGMKAVGTDLFGLLDDDDELHPNHVRTLLATLRHQDGRDLRGPVGLAYAAGVEVSAGEGRKERPEWRDQLLPAREQRRVIAQFGWCTSSLMRRHRFHMMANAWIARSGLIDADLLDDPELDTGEVLHLVLQLAQRTHFAFSVEVTAVRHSHAFGEAAGLDGAGSADDQRRIALRNWQSVFPEVLPYDLGAVHPFPFHQEQDRTVVVFDSDLLPRMTLRGDVVRSPDGRVVVPAGREPGAVVRGPGSRLPSGAYTLSCYAEIAERAVAQGRLLRVDVSCHDGRTVLAARDLLAEEVAADGAVVRIDVPFDVWPELAIGLFEFRLWHGGRARTTVFRLVVRERAVEPAAEPEPFHLAANYN